MPSQSATVFGGTGFLGRRIVRHLRDAGFAVRIASRHPDSVTSIFRGAGSPIDSYRLPMIPRCGRVIRQVYHVWGMDDVGVFLSQ